MFACRWFEVVLLVSSVAKTAHTSVGQEIRKAPSEFSRDLSQADIELILNAQTGLRRHFIRSLAEVRDRITEAEGFDPVVGGIIQDLQTRNLDPFKLLSYASSSEEQLPKSLKAEVTTNLQGGSHSPIIVDWGSLLQISGRSDIQLWSEHLEKIQELSEPFVNFVLRGIHKNSIKANSKLLADVLYNFRFREYSPELTIILENVNQSLSENVKNLLDFHIDAALVKGPDDVLSDILKFISRKKQSDARLVYQIDQILSALSDAVQVKNTSELWELFDLMLQDDYPPDVIQAKNALSLAIRNNEVGVDLSGVNENIKGNPPMEKLLMLMAKLSGSSFFQREVHAVYPHIKLRYLTSKGQFFRPRTAGDVAFLLNSFLTAQQKMNPTTVEEVLRVFIVSDWEKVLKNFDFSRYSKPRPLVVDMIQGLLNEPSKLPLCSIIILRYFLRNNPQVSRCTADDFRKESTDLWAHAFRAAPDTYPKGLPLTPMSDDPVKSLFGSEWEASRLPPKWLSATAPHPSSPVAATPPSAPLFTIAPSLNSPRPPDPEGLKKSTAGVISDEPSSSVSLRAWPSTHDATTIILPFSPSASSSHLSQLPAYSPMTGTSTAPILSLPQPSVETALPNSPTTRTESWPPQASPSPPAPCESSTSAYSQCHPSTVGNILEVATAFLPLRGLDDTTPVDSVDQGSSSATEIKDYSATATIRLSASPNSMAPNKTNLNSDVTQLKEKTWQSSVELTSDEYLMSETEATSVDEIERTSSRPSGEAESKKPDNSEPNGSEANADEVSMVVQRS